MTNADPDQAIALKIPEVPADAVFHVTPSELYRMVPPTPTAIIVLPEDATPRKLFVVPLDLEVQDTPSALVRIVPLAPTATNCVLAHVTA